jgi:hypothetical protein
MSLSKPILKLKPISQLSIPIPIWAHPQWKVLHLNTRIYPRNPTPDQKEQRKRYVLDTIAMIPCPMCRSHFSDILLKRPLNDEALANGDSLSRWMWEAHRDANINAGRSIFPYELLDDYLEGKLDNFSSGSTPSSESSSESSFLSLGWILGIVLLFVFAIVIGIVLFLYLRKK